MGVTDVVRGSDHVTNTATQIQIIEALGGHVPNFAHHSLLTGPQGESLSKRLGTLSLRDLREAGIQPAALLSLMARLGSADPVELRTDMQTLLDGFDISRFGSAPTKFDMNDLYPLTAHYLQGLDYAEVKARIDSLGVPDDIALLFWQVTRGNISTLADLDAWWVMFRDGAEPVIEEEDAEFIVTAMTLLPEGLLDESSWSTWTAVVKEETGRKGKALFMPLRKALTGRAKGPEMADFVPLMQTKPTYTQLEAWVLEQSGGALDADGVTKLNDSITGYIHTDETRKEILGSCGIEDNGTILDAVNLNNLDDWQSFHAQEIA
jgi:glutamyl-tRNA synthetase